MSLVDYVENAVDVDYPVVAVDFSRGGKQAYSLGRCHCQIFIVRYNLG
jgi:hypothetical protein